MNWLGEKVQEEIGIEDTVLDLGCGNNITIDGLGCWSYLGVDVWPKYLDSIKLKQNTVRLDVTKELDRFQDKSYDVVICLDVLEHLELYQARYVLDNMIRICRKKAIIFTPSKWSDNESAVKDAWGLGMCPYQKHRSLIPLELLSSKGFRVRTDNADSAFYGVYNGNCV